MTCTTQIFVVLLIGCAARECFLQPIRSTTKIWVVHVVSMEFLRSLLRRRFASAQVATSRNIDCFLTLQENAWGGLNYKRKHFPFCAILLTLRSFLGKTGKKECLLLFIVHAYSRYACATGAGAFTRSVFVSFLCLCVCLCRWYKPGSIVSD